MSGLFNDPNPTLEWITVGIRLGSQRLIGFLREADESGLVVQSAEEVECVSGGTPATVSLGSGAGQLDVRGSVVWIKKGRQVAIHYRDFDDSAQLLVERFAEVCTRGQFSDADGLPGVP